MPETPTVRPGQIWADNDKRSSGRYVRIVAIEPGREAEPYRKSVPPRAVVEQVAYNEHDRVSASLGARQTRIRLDRFRPTSTGYRLVQEAPDGDA